MNTNSEMDLRSDDLITPAFQAGRTWLTEKLSREVDQTRLLAFREQAYLLISSAMGTLV
jgi:hypothetical protein